MKILRMEFYELIELYGNDFWNINANAGDT